MLIPRMRSASAALCGLIIFTAGMQQDQTRHHPTLRPPSTTTIPCTPAASGRARSSSRRRPDTNNDLQTKGFDALTDAGLLTRTSQEKKRFLIGSKQVNDYDVSDKGRTQWTVDQSQPATAISAMVIATSHPSTTSP